MERLNKMGLIVILFALISSCSASYKFNREIKKLDNANSLFTFKENKRIFKYLKKELNNSTTIYYITSTIDGENDVEGITASIFDEEKNTFYNLSKLEENIAVKKQLFGKSEALDDAYNEFIYSVFKQGSCDSLIALSDKTKYASGINSEDRIYKINLHDKKQNNVCNFQRIYYFQDIYDQR